jgi:membrane fusion protein (multidrug efflux system)
MTHKTFNMQNVFKIAMTGTMMVILLSCGNSVKEEKSTVTDKKVKLAKLQDDQKKLNDQITALQQDIAKADPTAASTARLVTVQPITPQDFNHYIELQGKVDADNIAYVTPRGGALGSGQVKEVYVKAGDFVKKGQLLVKLDDAVQRRQIDGLQTQLAYAKDIYQRQQNLWKENIGTEVQVLTAKNNVDMLEKQLATAREQVSFANVYAEMSGVADEVNIKVGEIFTGAPPTDIKIINTTSLKVTANIPENYTSRVHKGTAVEIIVPDANNRKINSNVSVVSQSIDPNSRGFVVEARISNGASLKPNQVAIMKILDYSAKNVLVVPLNTVQSDEKGKYVYVMEKQGDKMVAAKRIVQVGESYGNIIEIKEGSLRAGDQIITEGYQSLYEGQVITTSIK